MKIDLHCHSKYSKRATLWFMQKLGCPESFTEPMYIYQTARKRGMSAVTITDHNGIEGCLEIAHLPHTFISCEYTTYFPEDQCKIHVLAYDITESQHRELQEVRKNIFEFAHYLNANDIHHSCAHPLFWVNDKLTIEHIEQLVLLFKNWEINGSVHEKMNAATLHLISGLTEKSIQQLAAKYNMVPYHAECWCKNLTAGSDDHGGIHIANAYTQVLGASSLPEFWAGLEAGHSQVHYIPSKPHTFARTVYSIAYQFYKTKLGIERHSHKDFLLHSLDHMLQTPHKTGKPPRLRLSTLFTRTREWRRNKIRSDSIVDRIREEAEKLIRQDPQLASIICDTHNENQDLDRKWFEFVNQVSNRLFAHAGHTLVERGLKAHLFDVFHSMGSTAAIYALLAPYFVSFSLYAKQRRFSQSVRARFADKDPSADKPNGHRHVFHFTDTLDDVNGVAKTLKQYLQAAQALEKNYTIVTCSNPLEKPQRGVRRFTPVDKYAIPEYSELCLYIPPFLQMLDHCYKSEVTHFHVATPGPIGLAALGIARILQKPITGTYHTEFPHYAKALTGDSYIEELLWYYMQWFYNQLDSVYVPSNATKKELIARGIEESKIRLYPRGVDTVRFHPEHRSDILHKNWNVPHDAIVFLYVGRVSKEKNLHVLAKAFADLAASTERSLQLVVVGDGPFLTEMKNMLANSPAIFTGYMQGKELSSIYASSHVFVFPSTTDTFGNVVLEAQASGLPVITTDKGGPQENILPDRTGFVVKANDVQSLSQSMRILAENAELQQKMKAAARNYAEKRGFSEAFSKLYDMYVSERAAETPQQESHPFVCVGEHLTPVA